MHETELPIHYILEVYCGDCVFQQNSAMPFQAFAIGDYIDPAVWNDNLLDATQIYRVTKIRHLIMRAGSSHVTHSLGLFVEPCARQELNN